jgi:CRP/FNR family transcriptional regulator, cyclic AMP receptor protein
MIPPCWERAVDGEGKAQGQGTAAVSGAAAAATPPADPAADHPTAMVELLGKIHIFTGLSDVHLRRIAAIGTEEQHASGRAIFAEGDVGDKFYIVLEGAVRISRMVPGMGEEALAILQVGAYFGEMSLIDDAPRSAHALVHERCKLFVISKQDLEDLLFVDRDLAYELLWNFVRTLSRRLRSTNDKMTFLATTNKF